MVDISLFAAGADHGGGAVEEYKPAADLLHVITEVLRWRYGASGRWT
jgi:hypothetical protein